MRGQRSQIENDLFNALDAREQTAQKLDETRLELEQAGKSLENERAQWAAQIAAMKERQNEERLAAQNTVSIVWPSEVASFPEAAVSDDPGGDSTAPRASGVGPQAPAEDMAGAMRAALAVAQSEVNESRRAGDANDSASKQRSRAASKRSKSAPAPNKSPATVSADAPAPAGNASRKNAPAPAMPIELDAETRRKLKTLKRINPHKSDRELLETIATNDIQPLKAKPKRGWFASR